MPAILDAQLFSNNSVSLLAGPLSATDLTFTVMSGHGAKYPQPLGDGSDWFLITLEDQTASHREIVKVIARTGDHFVIAPGGRGQEGTTARAWGASAGNDTLVDLRLTAESIRRLSNSYAISGYPGITNTAQALDQLFALFSMSGTRLYDQPYTVSPQATTTKITLQQAYVSGSVAVFVGGLRQKLNMDFTESAPNEITLNFVLTQAMINEGQHLTVDFIPA